MKIQGQREKDGEKKTMKSATNIYVQFSSTQILILLDTLVAVVEILTKSCMRDPEAHDSNWSSFFWNISQNSTKEKHRSQAAGVAGCVTPGGDIFLPHLGRSLLGAEKLLLQGIPYFRLHLANETEVNMSDLAGNAMSLSVVSACMLGGITARKFKANCEEEAKKKKIDVFDFNKNVQSINPKVAKAVLKTAKMPPIDCMDADEDFTVPKGDDCLVVFADLADLGKQVRNVFLNVGGGNLLLLFTCSPLSVSKTIFFFRLSTFQHCVHASPAVGRQHTLAVSLCAKTAASRAVRGALRSIVGLLTPVRTRA